MFTHAELSVLQAALRSWDGPYGPDWEKRNLNPSETDRHFYQLKVAENLAERVEGILEQYARWDMAHQYMVDPLGH